VVPHFCRLSTDPSRLSFGGTGCASTVLLDTWWPTGDNSGLSGRAPSENEHKPAIKRRRSGKVPIKEIRGGTADTCLIPTATSHAWVNFSRGKLPSSTSRRRTAAAAE
jgi:hypothetical protein